MREAVLGCSTAAEGASEAEAGLGGGERVGGVRGVARADLYRWPLRGSLAPLSLPSRKGSPYQKEGGRSQRAQLSGAGTRAAM